jgi:hypothetical protein
VTLGGVGVARELQPGDPQTIGPYRLVGQLGQGGMGRVYLGVSPGGRPVAVKAIRAELAADPDFRRRFGREVAAARRVNGVFTAMVVDADIDGPMAWMATAYVPGPSLAEAVDRHGPVPEGSLLTLAAGLAESLSAIHAAGVVHRDLKPSNVLLAEDGPRVIDFGISRAAESTALTQTGLVIGSPGFMSPEQAQGHDVGPASDIFSLGAVLAFAATGQGPFGTGTTASLLYRVVYGLPDLDQVPDVARPLIERCLAKDPRLRPTASGLLTEVGALQPTTNWLPDSLIRSYTRDSAAGPASGAAAAAGAGAAGVAAGAAAGMAAGAAAGMAAGTAADAADGATADVADGALADAGMLPTQTAMGSRGAATWDSQLLAPANDSPTAPSGPAPPPGSGPAPPPPGGTNGAPPGPRPRRRLRRPVVLAWIIGVLIVVSGATAFALIFFTGNTTTPTRPAADTSSATVPTSPGPTSSSAPASPRGASSSPRASSPASAPSSAYTNTSQPTSPPPTSHAPTSPPPTSPPPTSPPPTSAPPTSPPPTSAPPTSAPPTSAPPTSAPPTSASASSTDPSTPASASV